MYVASIGSPHLVAWRNVRGLGDLGRLPHVDEYHAGLAEEVSYGGPGRGLCVFKGLDHGLDRHAVHSPGAPEGSQGAHRHAGPAPGPAEDHERRVFGQPVGGEELLRHRRRVVRHHRHLGHLGWRRFAEARTGYF